MISMTIRNINTYCRRLYLAAQAAYREEPDAELEGKDVGEILDKMVALWEPTYDHKPPSDYEQNPQVNG